MLENTQIFLKNLSCFSVEKKIETRKNDVFLLKTSKTGEKEKFIVYKKYSQLDKMPREIEMLYLLKGKGVAVPQIYDTGKNFILMEYLEGPLFIDFFCWQENTCGPVGSSLKGPAYQAIYSLCSWFSAFYAVSREVAGRQLIMGDVNFRNFIIREKIYGINLEECRDGKIEEDIGSLCAFALTYLPSYTSWKISMAGEMFRILSSELDLDKELLKQEIQKELLAISVRRKTIHEMMKFQVFDLLEKSIYFA